MAKRHVSAKAILHDLSVGLSDNEILKKYDLSNEQLQSTFQKLIKTGLLTQEALDRRRAAEKAIPKEGPSSTRQGDAQVEADRLEHEAATADAKPCPLCEKAAEKGYEKCPGCGATIPKLVLSDDRASSIPSTIQSADWQKERHGTSGTAKQRVADFWNKRPLGKIIAVIAACIVGVATIALLMRDHSSGPISNYPSLLPDNPMPKQISEKLVSSFVDKWGLMMGTDPRRDGLATYRVIIRDASIVMVREGNPPEEIRRQKNPRQTFCVTLKLTGLVCDDGPDLDSQCTGASFLKEPFQSYVNVVAFVNQSGTVDRSVVEHESLFFGHCPTNWDSICPFECQGRARREGHIIFDAAGFMRARPPSVTEEDPERF